MKNEEGLWETKEFKWILEQIPSTVVGRDIKRFTERDYEPSLREYTEENRGLFEKIQRLCAENREIEAEVLRRISAALVEAVEQDLNRPGLRRKWNARALQFDTYKMVVLTYLSPAVLNMKLEISEPFVYGLREEWARRYPGQQYQVATEEKIANGFKERWYRCYITQAVCRYLGKDDDGYELTAFRSFRDGYLRACLDGAELIEEYYRNAPGIVSRIELYGLGDMVYPELWERFLEPCLRDIEAGRNEDCKARYIRMVRELENRFLFREENGEAVFA